MLLQGNTYELPIQIKDSSGNIITPDMITKAQFVIGKYEKFYGTDVTYDFLKKAFIIPLTEQETFDLKGTIEWQARFVFTTGQIDGTLPKKESVYNSITSTLIGGE